MHAYQIPQALIYIDLNKEEQTCKMAMSLHKMGSESLLLPSMLYKSRKNGMLFFGMAV